MQLRHRLVVVIGIGVVSAGLLGAPAVGGGGDPVDVTVSADTVADDGFVIEETATIEPTNGTSGDEITLAAKPPADGGLVGLDVQESAYVEVINETHARVELNSTGEQSLQVTVEQRLNATLAGKAVTFHERPTVTVVGDETDSGLLGQPIVQVSILAQQTIAGFELEDPHGQSDPLEIPVEEAGALTITNVTDEYGNRIYEGDSSGDPEVEVSYTIESTNRPVEISGEERNYTGSGRISIEGETEKIPIGEHDVAVDLSGEITETNLFVYPNEVNISTAEGLQKGDTAGLTVETGVNIENIDVLNLELRDQSNEVGYNVSLVEGDFVFHNSEESKGREFIGEYGDLVIPEPDIGEDGRISFELSGIDSGNYTLDVDVMPELTAASETTTETVSFRVHGPINSGSVALNRTMLGTVVDPAPVSVTLGELRDEAGVLVATPNATVTNVTVGETSVSPEQTPVIGPDVTVEDIDTTALTGPTNGTTHLPVAVTLDCNTTLRTTAPVSLVHETRTLNTSRTWAPVSAPMPVTDLRYMTAEGTPAPDAVAVGWNETAQSYERIDPTERTRPQAWHVSGAARVGVVYNTTATQTTHTYSEGWHHVGPAVDLTEQTERSLNESFTDLGQAAVYTAAGAPVATETPAQPYTTYWINATTTVQATVPGGYQPANRTTTEA